MFKKKIKQECWNLDSTFYNWLRVRLPIYYEEASKIIDLEYNKFDYNCKQYTQKEIIERMIILLNLMQGKDELDEGFSKNREELLNLWSLVLPSMWW